MSPDLENRFYTAFPDLFRGRFKPVTESLMCYGLECDDGWFDLLWQHCIKLERLALAEGRQRGGENWPEIIQIKEKLGTIRCYIRHESEAMRLLREKLLRLSEGTELDACFRYLESERCFGLTLPVKVESCQCYCHGETQPVDGNTTELGGYEVQVDVVAYLPMGQLKYMSLYFYAENRTISQQAQALCQVGAVLLVNCSYWDLHELSTLHIDRLEQLVRLPLEHEQVMSAWIDQTGNS